MVFQMGKAGIWAGVVGIVSGMYALPLQAQTSGSSNGNAGWFVPKSSQPAAVAPPRTVTHVPAHRSSVPAPVSLPVAPPADGGEAQPQKPPVLPLPPVPTPTPVAKGAPPPAPFIGVISVPEVMHLSSAAQQAEKTLSVRRDKLVQDSQKEQASLRDEQQKLQAQARGMTSAQIQAHERKLQMRAMKVQRDLRNRNRIIQEAAQVSFGQIERELLLIIRQIAESHNMNVVLHREQTVLSVRELDITNEVAAKLNSTLPSVFVPAEDVDPEALAKSGTMPTTENPGPAAPAPQVTNKPAAPAAATTKAGHN